MPTEPTVVVRPPQPYVGVKTTIAMNEIGTFADRVFPELFGWLGQRGIAPAGAPFFRYHRFADGQLEMEAGVPVGAPAAGDGRVEAGTLPAGRYASLVHTGSYDQLP